MFKQIKNFFCRRSIQQKVDDYLSECSIEYKPLENKYYPKHNGEYFYRSYLILRFDFEIDARNMIKLYLEQEFDYNVSEIKM